MAPRLLSCGPSSEGPSSGGRESYGRFFFDTQESIELTHSLRFAAAGLAACLSAACGGSAEVAGATESAVRTLQVAPSRVECTGVAPGMCLQVRESSSAPWTLLHGVIEGFSYEPGFLYEIRVREEAVANPPADASSIRRILVSVVSRTPYCL